MKALLICPSGRKDVGLLAQAAPLATVPLLGQSLLEYWLSHLACTGVKEVIVLADDRAEQVRTVVGTGVRWGLTVNLIEESRELTAAQTLLKYGKELDGSAPQNEIAVLDHFPGADECPLFTSYADYFAALQAWMPKAKMPDRVGVREVRPGVWANSHSHISPEAQLQAPCWVGKNVFVGSRAVIGPSAIVEDGAFIEPDARMANSVVGSDTFVGRLTEIADSLALGSTLINWKTGSAATVPDPFVLCALRKPARSRTAKWLKKISEVYSRNKSDVHVLLMNR